MQDDILVGARARMFIDGFTSMAKMRIERSLKDDRRAAPRWPMRQPMRLRVDGAAYDVISVDLGPGGVAVHTSVGTLAEGQLCTIDLTPQSQSSKLLHARILRREPPVGGVTLYGLAFVLEPEAVG